VRKRKKGRGKRAHCVSEKPARAIVEVLVFHVAFVGLR